MKKMLWLVKAEEMKKLRGGVASKSRRQVVDAETREGRQYQPALMYLRDQLLDELQSLNKRAEQIRQEISQIHKEIR